MLSASIVIISVVILYVYVIYPAAVVMLSRLMGPERTLPLPEPLPYLSLVVPAYNEASVIAAKVLNCRALDYPPDRLEIVIVSDGSTDGTAQVARAAAGPPVRIEEFPRRRGKTALLNQVIPALSGEIVVQSDANSQLERDALIEVVRPFSDPSVGCVVGQLVFSNRQDPRVAAGEGLYWSYENALKSAESRLGGTITANGGLYAFRKALFSPLPQHIAGDAADPLLIASRGYRVIFAPPAIAREKAAESLREEFGRKVRIMTQGLSAWVYLRGMLFPLRARAAFQLFSHKFLRWLLPWFLLLLPVLCFLPGAPSWARFFGALQLLFYALALSGLAGGEPARRLPLVRAALYFCVANAAALLATVKYLTGRRYAVWEKSTTSR